MKKLQDKQKSAHKQEKDSQKPQFTLTESGGSLENCYRILFNSVKEGILLLDFETEKIIEANPSITELTGIQSESVIGKEVWDLNLFENRKSYESTLEEIKKNGRTYVKEIHFRKKSGEQTTLELASNIYSEGAHKIIQCNIRNITPQNQAPAEDNKTKINQIADGTRALIWEVDLDGVYTYVNSISKNMLGYNPEELVGKKHFFDFFDPEKKEELKKQAFQAFKRKESIKNFVNCNIHKDGHKICLSTNGFPMLNKENNLIGYRGIDIDITAELEVEEALHQSEAKTRTILEAISTGIIIVDPETHTIVDANKEAARLFGEQKDKIIGNQCHKFICPAEDGKCPITDLGQLIDNTERTLINKDGESIPILKTVTQITVGGKKLLLENFTDITARKQTEKALTESEAKFRTLVAQSPDGIFTTDLTGNFLSVNKAMSDILKYSEEEFLSMKVWDILPKKYLPFYEERLAALIKGEKINRTIEYEAKGKDGSIHIVEALSAPFYKEGKIIGIQSYGRDITERKIFFEALKSNEQKFMALAEQSPNLIFINYQGRIVYVNQKCVDLMGYSKEEYYAEDFDFMILIDNDYKDIIRQNFYKSMNGLEVEPLDYRIVTKNNSKLDAVITTRLIDYNGGKAIMGTITDITERKQAEKNLLVEKERYKAITNAIPDLVFRLDKHGRYLDYKADEKELSFQKGAILGKLNREITPPEFANLIDEKIKTALTTGKAQHFEYQIHVPKKGIRRYEARMVVSGKDEVIAFARDITDKKQSEIEILKNELRYRELFENSGTPIWEVDMSETMSYLNDLKAKGIADFRKYFDENEEEVVNCVSKVKLLDANKEILNFLQANTKEQATTGLLDFFTEESFESAKEVLLELVEGKSKIDGEIPVKTFKNELRYVIFRISVANNKESLWANSLISFIDITYKKEAEKALKESEKRLHQIMENVDAVFYMISSITGELVYVNSAYEKVWGRSIASVKEDINTWLEAVHEEDKGLATALFEKGDGEVQYRIVLPDGSIRWIWDRMFPVMDEKGDVVFLCGMASDITESKQAEQILLESEAKLEEATKIAKLASWEFNIELKEFKFNDQFYELLGTTAEQEGGYYMSSEDYIKRFLDPEDGKFLISEALKSIETTDPDYNAHIDHRIKYRNGGEGYLAVNLRIEKDPSGRTTRIFGIMQDITERKRNEEAMRLFQTLIDNTNDSIEVIDLETGRFLDINKKACTDSGYTREELLEMSVFDLDPNQTKDTYKDLKNNSVNNDVNIIESSHRRKDGSVYPVEINVSVVDLGRTYIIAVVRDITERKLAEKELAESEERYRLLFQNAAEGILLVDVETMEFKLANKAMYNMFGYSEKELLKLKIKDLHPKESQNFVENDFKSLAMGEKNFTEDIPCLRKDGTIFYANIYNAIIYIDDRKHNIGFFTDITQQKEATSKIKLFRTLIDHSNDSIELIDLETGKFVDCNEKSYQELGYTRDEFLALKPTDLDTKLTEESSLELIEAVKNKGSMLSEGVVRRKDGSTFPIEVSLNYVKLDQEFIVAIGRDITDRKVLEKNLSTAAEIAKLGYWEYDVKSGNFVFDDQYYRLIHGSSTEKQGGNKMSAEEFVRRFVHPDDSHMVAKSLQEAISSPDPEYFGQAETRVFRDDGNITNVMVQFKVIKDQFGNTQTVYGVNQDITEIKQTENELISAKNKAEESDRLKSAFLANMSHEIRTPMNGILGFTELLKEPLLTGDEQKKYIDIIDKSGKRMLNIINDIISISKIEAGQVEVSIIDTNINDQLEYIYLFFKKEAREKNINFSIKDFLPKNEAMVRTDREKVYAVLINLVKNALKFTKEGSITVGCEKKGDFFEFYVKDTGSGIPSEKREIIFERFRQGSEAMNRDYEGAGLGLAISKGYIEMLGGKIWVYPNMYKDEKTGISQERGSAFYFTIPIQATENTENNSDSSDEPKETPNKNKKLKVLIAEDDEISLLYINKIAKDFADKILNAADGAEAVDICKEISDIDLILMDMKMPVMGGHEATQKIREFNKDVIIIAQTAYGMTGDKDKALEAGCNDYISKPINRNELLELINQYFD